MKSILIVEDEKTVSNLYRVILKDEYEVEIAGDTKEAYAALEKKSYDLVILDLMLPGGSGAEIAVELRKHHRRTCIIIISAILGGLDGKEDLSRKVQQDLHANAFLSKPCSPALIIKTVRELIGSKQEEEAARG
ncbi:MAG: response regulator [Planctomycetes bacterium]|nr:response regulator [Planctomycetota bacterium]